MDHATIRSPSPRRRSRRLLRAERSRGSRSVRAQPFAQSAVLVVLLVGVVVFGRFPTIVTRSWRPRLLRELTLPGIASAATSVNLSNGLSAMPQSIRPASSAAPSSPVQPARNGGGSRAEALNLASSASTAAGSGTIVGQRESPLPLFYEYAVQPGDTLSTVAKQFGITPDYIIWNNSEVVRGGALPAGITLQIPAVEGIIHSVRLGETVVGIAAEYGADPRDIVDFAANGLDGDPASLRPNELILVPGGRVLPQPSAPAESAPPPDVSTAGWRWPVVGPLTSTFGPWHPLGIDIAVPIGTPVLAAHGGTVVFAGGDPCCSYGYHVILDNGSGYETVYAHLSAFRVKLGDHVMQGQVLGLSGDSGRSTGPHVHFELHRDGVRQNPEVFLPLDPWFPPNTPWPPPSDLPEYPPCPGAPHAYGC